ncbi:hypothetical protein ACRAWD_27885 [Caulobacter segnis]
MRLGLIVGLAAGATACASPFKTAQVDPSSPIAAEAAAAAKPKAPAPREVLGHSAAIPDRRAGRADQVRAAVVLRSSGAGEALAAARRGARLPGDSRTRRRACRRASVGRRQSERPALTARTPTDAQVAPTPPAALRPAMRGRASAPPSQPQAGRLEA